ncbi:MAG: MBL fold metallo-hydrolase [Ruminococcaceae bacterium]|nr:MBL fold metallo-hydrolase [Oscillospiraceae bacterium]
MSGYEIGRVAVGDLSTNCYVVKNKETGDACVIDPGDNLTLIQDLLHRMDTQCRLILLTHGHFDHILAVGDLRSERAPVCIHKSDAHMLTQRDMFSTLIPYDPRPFEAADYVFDKEGSYTVAGFTFYVIPSPGHTKGSVCYLFDDNLFTGDTLFKGGIGTLNFGGDAGDMRSTLRMLCNLPGDYAVYPGHDERTTLSDEIAHNPFLQEFKRK